MPPRQVVVVIRGRPSVCRSLRPPLLLMLLVLLTGCSAFGGDAAAEPEPTPGRAANTVDAVPIGATLTVTAAVDSMITDTSFVVQDADLPRDGLLVLSPTPLALRPSDLVTVDGEIALFRFADLARSYGSVEAAPYAHFEGSKVLRAHTVRSWA